MVTRGSGPVLKLSLTVTVDRNLLDALDVYAREGRHTLSGAMEVLLERFLDGGGLAPMPPGAKMNRRVGSGTRVSALRRYYISPKVMHRVELLEEQGYSKSFLAEEAIRIGCAITQSTSPSEE